MVQRVIAATFVGSTVGHPYGQCECPPVFRKEKNVEHKRIRNDDMMMAPPILATSAASGKCEHFLARGILGFERRRRSDAKTERLTPRQGVTPSTGLVQRQWLGQRK